MAYVPLCLVGIAAKVRLHVWRWLSLRGSVSFANAGRYVVLTFDDCLYCLSRLLRPSLRDGPLGSC